VLRKANGARGRRVAEDLAAMRPLDVSKLPEFTEEDIRVSMGVRLSTGKPLI
jgi:hypothetical protein